MSAYEIGVLGPARKTHALKLREAVRKMVRPFGLAFGKGKDVSWLDPPALSSPSVKRNLVIVFFAGPDGRGDAPGELLGHIERGVPVIPVVPSLQTVSESLPEALRSANAMELAACGAAFERLSAAALEHVGLLRSQRRVFLSYKRSESEEAARQLHESLNAAGFDVFLDTYDVRPGADFQTDLLHFLCDSDVVVVLDTENYASSHWTQVEYKRANLQGIPILGVVWPKPPKELNKAAPSPPPDPLRDAIALNVGDLLAGGGLALHVVMNVVEAIERLRGEGVARRHDMLVDGIRVAVSPLGGSITPTSDHRIVRVKLPGRRTMELYPLVGVPTAVSFNNVARLHETRKGRRGKPLVAYNELGIAPKFSGHLKWLDRNLATVGALTVADATLRPSSRRSTKT